MNNTSDKIYPLEDSRIEWIKSQLVKYAQNGRPRYYQVDVDGFKIVERTKDVDEFDLYKAAVTDDTEEVVIRIFSGNSHRNNKFCFVASSSDDGFIMPEDSMNGFEFKKPATDTVDSKVTERVTLERERWEREQLSAQLEQAKDKLKEAEEYISMLEEELEEKVKNPIQSNLNLGEIASVVFEGLLRRNPEMISVIPGGEGLAGIFSKKNGKANPAHTTETEASFSPQRDDEDLSDDQAHFVNLLRRLEEIFDDSELVTISEIIDRLSENKSLVGAVADLLDIQIKTQL